MSILEWQVNSISNFASFFIVLMHNSPQIFKLIHFLLCIKGSNESPNFENFVCSGENLPNSSCYFPNHQLVFLQVDSSLDFSSFFSVITFNSSVSLQLMHFLLWTKGSHENTNFDTFKCSDENLPNSACHFPNHKSVFLQILHDSSVS